MLSKIIENRLSDVDSYKKKMQILKDVENEIQVLKSKVESVYQTNRIKQRFKNFHEYSSEECLSELNDLLETLTVSDYFVSNSEYSSDCEEVTIFKMMFDEYAISISITTADEHSKDSVCISFQDDGEIEFLCDHKPEYVESINNAILQLGLQHTSSYEFLMFILHLTDTIDIVDSVMND